MTDYARAVEYILDKGYTYTITKFSELGGSWYEGTVSKGTFSKSTCTQSWRGLLRKLRNVVHEEVIASAAKEREE